MNFRWKLQLESSESTQFNVHKVQFGDGYEQAISLGINNSRRTWQTSCIDNKAVIDEIYRFLLNTKGVTPFSITPVPNEPSLNVRLDGEISRKNLGGNVWQLDFTLIEVF